MKWFKFYGQDYLSDPKMLALTASERSCWVTLLAYGSVNDNGMITFLEEEQLMAQAGISPMNDEWDRTRGVLEKLEKLEMITIDNGVITLCNWSKRQETSLTPYERVKRYREKKRIDNDDDNDRVDKIRLDKNKGEERRIEERRKEEKVDFDIFWNLYDKKVGRPKSEAKWEKLSFEEQTAIIAYIPRYKTAKPDKTYRKDPITFFNNRSWEDEIVGKDFSPGIKRSPEDEARIKETQRKIEESKVRSPLAPNIESLKSKMSIKIS